MKTLQKRAASLAIMALTAGMLAMHAMVAVAAPSHDAGPDQSVITGDPITFTKKSSHRNSIDNVITCYGQSDYPHNSSGTPGTVVGKSRTWCTAPIAQVGVENAMYRYLPNFGFTVVGFGGLETLPGAGPVTTYSFDSCQGHLAYWYVRGTHTLVAPPGYQPQSVTMVTETPARGVNC